jgi:hypothetical protein
LRFEQVDAAVLFAAMLSAAMLTIEMRNVCVAA